MSNPAKEGQMPCNKPDCSLCRIDREGCQCLARDAGCWYCAPNKFNRPTCSDEHQAFLDWKIGLSRQIDEKIAHILVEYDIASLPEFIAAKQAAMMAATTRGEAEMIFKKLMKWSIVDAAIATGHAQSERISPKAIRKAENLAKMLEEKGDDKGAARQRKRAAKIQKELSKASES